MDEARQNLLERLGDLPERLERALGQLLAHSPGMTGPPKASGGSAPLPAFPAFKENLGSVFDIWERARGPGMSGTSEGASSPWQGQRPQTPTVTPTTIFQGLQPHGGVEGGASSAGLSQLVAAVRENTEAVKALTEKVGQLAREDGPDEADDAERNIEPGGEWEEESLHGERGHWWRQEMQAPAPAGGFAGGSVRGERFVPDFQSVTRQNAQQPMP